MTKTDERLLSAYSKDALLSIIEKDYEKAQYWVEKSLGGDKGRVEKEYQLRVKLRESGMRYFFSDFIEYHRGDFTWIFALMACMLDENIRQSSFYAMLFGEGEDLAVIDQLDEGPITVFTSELLGKIEQRWQVDYDRKQTIARLFSQYGLMSWSCDNEVEGAAAMAVVSDYVFLGQTKRGLIVMTEILTYEEARAMLENDADLSAELQEVIEKHRADMQEFNSQQPTDPSDPLAWPEATVRSYDDYRDLFNEYNKRFKGHRTVAYASMWFSFASIIGELVGNYSGMKVDPLADRDLFYETVEQVFRQQKCLKLTDMNDYIEQELTSAAIKICQKQHFPADNDSVMKTLQALPVWIHNKEQFKKQTSNRNTTMDKKMQETLRRIMKKHGLRDKYENLIKSTRTTVDAWFGWVESIYAVARLHSYITNEKDRPKFLAADKEWTEYVINEDKCSAISEYVERHTKPVVIQAVHYLMDNGLWEAPLGIEGIRKANADLYKGMKTIDEAVEYLRTEGKLKVEEQPADTAEASDVLPVFDDAEEATGKRTDAQRAFSYCNDAFKHLQERFATLSKYFEQDELTDLLEKENTKLSKENARLTESIKTVNQQYNEAKKDIEAQKQIAFNATKERNTAIDNFNKLQKQYNEMKEEYDYLKREAQKQSEVPKAKIIPGSKINSLPLIGPKALCVLIPFLKKYNIVIDETK